jgi:hypothetical protein
LQARFNFDFDQKNHTLYFMEFVITMQFLQGLQSYLHYLQIETVEENVYPVRANSSLIIPSPFKNQTIDNISPRDVTP